MRGSYVETLSLAARYALVKFSLLGLRVSYLGIFSEGFKGHPGMCGQFRGSGFCVQAALTTALQLLRSSARLKHPNPY